MYLCIEVIQIQLKKKSHRLPHKKHPMIHIKMLRFGLFLDGQFLGSYFATFAGKTSSRPRLFSKDLALKDLPRLYKAADAFVLPTRGVRRLAMENKYHPDESSFRNMKNLYMRHSKSFFFKNGPCSLGCENSILGGGGCHLVFRRGKLNCWAKQQVKDGDGHMWRRCLWNFLWLPQTGVDLLPLDQQNSWVC